MLRFILLATIIAHIYADTCDFKPFHECLRPPKPQEVGKRGPPKQGGGGPLGKSPVFKCLEDAKCQPPTRPPRPVNKANFDQAKQCFDKVYAGIKADIQACVQKQVPSFTFPVPKSGGEHEHEEHHGGFGRQGERGGFGGGKGIDYLINASCTTPQAKASAQACVKALPTAQPKEKVDFAARKAQLCDKKASCLKSSLSATCQQQMTQIEQAKCSCASSTISANSAKIEASLKACKALLPPPPPPPPGSQAPPSKRKEPGFSASLLAKRFCQDDPCKPKL